MLRAGRVIRHQLLGDRVMNSDMALFHVFLIAAPMARARLKIGKSDFSRYYLLQARYFYPRNLHNMGN